MPPPPTPGALLLPQGCYLFVLPLQAWSQRGPGSPGPLPLGAESLGGGVGSAHQLAGPQGRPRPSPHPQQAWGAWKQACPCMPPPHPDEGRGTSDLLPHPALPAAQEARNKFEEAERSLRDMEESIRYGARGLAIAGPCHHLPHGHLLPCSPEEVVMGSC